MIFGRAARGALTAGALALAAGCAASRPASRPATDDAPAAARSPDVSFPDAELVAPGGTDANLAGKSDDELLALGTAAYAVGDLERAAAAFDRIADLFPSSRHRATALYDAGLAHRGLERWTRALERFRELADRYVGPDADEARFFVAECLYRTGRLAEASAELTALAARTDLDAAHRVRALTERGVVELESGDLDGAERSLQRAAATWQGAAREPLDAPHAAKAQFYLGEVERGRFEAVRLDPAAPDAELSARLEEKSQRLLSAQAHYLRAARSGDAGWAVAAGARVGELYDALHASLLEAPPPPGLDPEAEQAYRVELRRRVHVLASKAVVAYDETVSAARRTGVDHAFVARAEEALARLRQIVAEDDSREGAARPGSGGR